MNYSKIIKSARIADLSGSANEIVNIYKKSNISAYPDYQPMVVEIEKQNSMLITAINKSKAQSEQADMDARRDECVSAINALALGYLNVPAEPIKSSANKFWTIFSKYGTKINNLSYTAESAQIKSLLEELTAADMVGAVSELPHMEGLIANLQTAQAEFEKAELKYDSESATLKGEDSASTIKPLMLQALNVVVDYHNAIVQFKDENFKNIADTIDKVVRDLNVITKSRRGKKNESTQDAPPI
ncbi:MAG: DUF6261 family protein [Bacteroidales bacterium]